MGSWYGAIDNNCCSEQDWKWGHVCHCRRSLLHQTRQARLEQYVVYLIRLCILVNEQITVLVLRQLEPLYKTSLPIWANSLWRVLLHPTLLFTIYDSCRKRHWAIWSRSHCQASVFLSTTTNPCAGQYVCQKSYPNEAHFHDKKTLSKMEPYRLSNSSLHPTYFILIYRLPISVRTVFVCFCGLFVTQVAIASGSLLSKELVHHLPCSKLQSLRLDCTSL